jgi:hypothetical protein
VDNKVVAFSPTHTSLRFVRRKAADQAAAGLPPAQPGSGGSSE